MLKKKLCRLLLVLPLGLSLGLPSLLWAQDTALQIRLDAINERLAKIQQHSMAVDDVNKLENLQRIYGYYLDKQLWEEVTDLFSDDGTMEIGTSGVKTGKENIRSYLYSLTENLQGPFEGEMYNHFQLQPVITLNEDGVTASGRWRAFMQLGSHGEGSGGEWGEGPYENEYIKEDGVWKIKTLHWYATFIGPYEGGWAAASREYIEAYSGGDNSGSYSFPNVVRPDFHYPNPVTGN